MTGALDRLRGTAKRLTDKFGKSVTIVRETSTFNTSTGEETTTTTETTTNATPPADYTTARIQDTLIQQGDTVIQVPAKGLDLGDPAEPQQSDLVKIDDATWNIVQIGKVYSGELVAAFVLHLRR